MPIAFSVDRQSRIPELDGLRGFAILIVVLLHYFYKPNSIAPPAYQHFQDIFRLGWTGVDLFFVLSGFLIGGILLDNRSSPSYFKTFYLRRFFRIIPIYYLWIFTYIVLIALAGGILSRRMNSHQLPPLGFSVYEHFFFLQNIFPPEYVTVCLYWFGVLWSLAIEEQFYLIAPLVVRFASRRALYVLSLSVIVLAPLLRTYLCLYKTGLPLNAFSSTPCRADALSFGILAALLWREESFHAWLKSGTRTLYLVFGLLSAGMFVLWYWFSDPLTFFTLTIGFTWVALFYFFLLLLVLGYRQSFLARWARAGWLRELGRVSYCVYVIHFGFAYLVFGIVLHTIPRFTDWRSACLSFAMLAPVYLLARFSWHYFERPLMQMGHRFQYTTETAIAGRNTATLASPGVDRA